jgi:hypothetical protein
MRYHELYEVLHRQPFQPFRLQLTNGESWVIRHPDFAAVTRSSVLVFVSSEDDDIPDRFNQYDLLHVVGVEPVNGQGVRRPSKRKKRRH